MTPSDRAIAMAFWEWRSDLGPDDAIAFDDVIDRAVRIQRDLDAQPSEWPEADAWMLRRKRDGFIRGAYVVKPCSERFEIAEIDGDEYAPLYTRPTVERLLAERDAEIARLRKACSAENDEICQTLGKALGCPWFKDNQDVFPGATEADGVCVGDHVAASLAAEAAKAVESLRAQLAGRVAVPDARPDLDPAELHARGECASEAEIAYNEGWNDCRDAMLAAAPEPAQAKENGNVV